MKKRWEDHEKKKERKKERKREKDVWQISYQTSGTHNNEETLRRETVFLSLKVNEEYINRN